jgi:hypothetical protein
MCQKLLLGEQLNHSSEGWASQPDHDTRASRCAASTQKPSRGRSSAHANQLLQKLAKRASEAHRTRDAKAGFALLARPCISKPVPTVRLTPAYADTIISGFKAMLAGGRTGEELARPQDLPGHLWAAGQFTSASYPPNGANNQASADRAPGRCVGR